MDQKHILWPAIIIIVLVAAGAIYYAMNLSGTPAPTPTPSFTVSETAELDQAATQNDQDLSELERMQSDLNAVDASQDNLGL